jgi:hypothetical protein
MDDELLVGRGIHPVTTQSFGQQIEQFFVSDKLQGLPQ